MVLYLCGSIQGEWSEHIQKGTKLKKGEYEYPFLFVANLPRTLSQVIIFEGPIDAVRSLVDPGETAVVEVIQLTERLFFLGGGGCT